MKLLRLEQGSPAWKLWRAGGVGGSDLAAILGVSPYEDATREAVLREKVTGWERETNFAMRRGHRLEPIARAAYETHAGCAAEPVCVEHDDAGWMRVSLDGLCRHRVVRDAARWILELKCPAWQTHDLILAGVCPEHFAVQCQWQLLVTGLGRCDLASFNNGQRFGPAEQLAVLTVGPDAELQARLIDEAEKFWREVQAARGMRPAAAGVSGIG